MCHTKLCLQHVRKTPARQLLKLPHDELDRLIGQADQSVDRAETTAFWLRGVKLEKTVREELASQNGGQS